MVATARGRPKGTAKQSNRSIAHAQAEMTAELKAAIDDLVPDIESLNENDIVKRHDIGLRLVAIIDDTSGKFGSDPKAALEAVMPLSKDGLRPMIHMARAYTKAELGKLMGLAHPQTREKLAWSHFYALTRIKDNDRAFNMARQAVDGGWSSRELANRVQAALGGSKGTSKAGRKAKRPATLAAGLDDIAQKTTMWVNAAEQVWTSDTGLQELYVQAIAATGNKPDAATLAGLVRTQAQVLSMELRLKTVTQLLTTLVTRAEFARQPRPAVA